MTQKIELEPGPNELEELYYRKHVMEALGEEEGREWLEAVDATREFYGGLPAMVNAQLKDILK